MVGDYISREAALSAQNKSMNLAECRTRLERLPATDVVAVVRCGECIRKNICWIESVDDNWYCADGKRKYGGPDDD